MVVLEVSAYARGSHPVVRVPLVVREGLPCGMRVTTIFSQKPGFVAFQFTYRALSLNK